MGKCLKCDKFALSGSINAPSLEHTMYCIMHWKENQHKRLLAKWKWEREEEQREKTPKELVEVISKELRLLREELRRTKRALIRA